MLEELVEEQRSAQTKLDYSEAGSAKKEKIPTASGFYWILEDIGISHARVICWVAVPTTPSLKELLKDQIKVLSPHNSVRRDAKGPDWNKDIVFPEWVPWDSRRFVAWSGPLKPDDELTVSLTGEVKHWLSIR